MDSMIVTPRKSMRVVDIPGLGSYELINRQRSANKYTKSPWAFAAMNIRGSELASLPWRITRNGEVLDKHPLIDMITKFSEESNYAESMIATEIDQLLYGHAFWFRDLDVLTRLNAATMKVNATNQGITSFTQTIDGKEVNTFKRDEIVYFREFHPETDLGAGISIMDVLKDVIALEREAGQYVTAFFQNDATPSLLLHTEQTISKAEMSKIKLWWDKTFRGSKNAHKLAVADRGLKAQILSQSLKDNVVLEIRDQARDDICVGMRVPKVLVGSMDKATYLNANEARKYMIEDLIIPRANHYADTINQDLVRYVDPSVVFEFDPSELPLLQENATAKWGRLNEAIERGVISAEFARQEMGWEESAKPTEDIVPAPLRSWKRKSIKAMKRGESADVEFDTDEVSVEEQLRIHTRLAKADTIQAVARAFLDD